MVNYSSSVHVCCECVDYKEKMDHKIIQVRKLSNIWFMGAEIQRNGGVGVHKLLQCVGFADQKHLNVLLVVAK